ncbi:hypothetical protein Lal_00020067 [Lupinus albus]|uniref:Uncharacterized protein n=1 Tax=Lupinus albus TaxID=3870 RepID=A0A6A4Q4N6_LUPAL|nr:hypothetical protein Lalb_Chr08g0239631 [Lupinus albus]KAF1871275.1 hypothetical protein Lal_00020067 [Lupinus albus]
MHLIQNLEQIRQDQTKPVTQTPSHDWLDRLRSRKGFPTGQHLDLGSFLLTNTNTITPHTRPDNPNPTRTRTHTHGSILAQLFNGASFIRTHPYKKCPRKQPHPTKVHPSSSPSPVSSTTTAATDPGIFPLNITAAVPEEEREREREQEEAETVGYDDDDYNDMKGFSKSEVTVIDTSSSGWKTVKFVYRKQNVWKVRERKRKSRLLAKKESNNTHMANEIGFSKENIMNMGGEKPTQLV